jgi:hypothetical protein
MLSRMLDRMRRKVPDTRLGAVVVGVVAGAVAGATAALTAGIWSPHDSVAHRLFAFVPGGMAGGVVLGLLLYAQNMRRATPGA